MTSFRKIAALVTCVAVIGAAAILWPVYKRNATERRLAEAARVRAEQGDAKAQSNLASMYYYGRGVPQDYAEAVRWSRQAADQGDAKAQYSLGLMYYKGQGLPRNDAEAVRWYRKAAEQGYPQAQYGLAFMYRRGEGVSQDDDEAARWYRKAAEQGDARAQHALGHRYLRGEGVPVDLAEAVRWYRKAADQGDAMAQYDLGLRYVRGQGVPQDFAEAARWFRKAADGGDGSAQSMVGVMYLEGLGVPRSYAEAGRWLALGILSHESQRNPLTRWTLIVAILLAVVVAFVPKRWALHTKWQFLCLMSAMFATMLAHELLLPGFSMALPLREQLGTIFRGTWRTVWLAFLAGGSVTCAVGAVMEAVRGSKCGGDQGQPPTTPTPPGVVSAP